MATSDFLEEDTRDLSPQSMANRWINYKQMFLIMYGEHIYLHYKNDMDSLSVLKYEILYL